MEGRLSLRRPLGAERSAMRGRESWRANRKQAEQGFDAQDTQTDPELHRSVTFRNARVCLHFFLSHLPHPPRARTRLEIAFQFVWHATDHYQ
jgi:hypothetical protein